MFDSWIMEYSVSPADGCGNVVDCFAPGLIYKLELESFELAG